MFVCIVYLLYKLEAFMLNCIVNRFRKLGSVP